MQSSDVALSQSAFGEAVGDCPRVGKCAPPSR
jgi:hypothetical protein